jgi:hypothetical protein
VVYRSAFGHWCENGGTSDNGFTIMEFPVLVNGAVVVLDTLYLNYGTLEQEPDYIRGIEILESDGDGTETKIYDSDTRYGDDSTGWVTDTQIALGGISLTNARRIVVIVQTTQDNDAGYEVCWEAALGYHTEAP